jgi:hypothetical protein
VGGEQKKKFPGRKKMFLSGENFWCEFVGKKFFEKNVSGWGEIFVGKKCFQVGGKFDVNLLGKNYRSMRVIESASQLRPTSLIIG